MTKLAQASFTTQLVDNPTNAALGGFAVSLLLAGTIVGAPTVVPSKDTPVSFTIADAGEYTVSVQRLLSDSSTAFGDPKACAPFTVAPDQVEVPLEVSVTLSAV